MPEPTTTPTPDDTEALVPLRRYFESHAVTARARGVDDRDWLDALILIERAEAALADAVTAARADERDRLRRHMLLTDDNLRDLHENAKAYSLANTALREKYGYTHSTTLAFLIEQGYLVPRAEAEALRARIEALVPDECWVLRARGVRCTDMVGGTFPGGGVWTEDMCCLPCRLRAALMPGNRKQVCSPCQVGLCLSCHGCDCTGQVHGEAPALGATR